MSGTGNSDRVLVLRAGNLTRRGGVTRKVIRRRDLLRRPLSVESIGYEASIFESSSGIEPGSAFGTRIGERRFNSLLGTISK